MATFTKRVLSGSSNGRGILVVATASPGTLIHTAVAGTTDFDEVYLEAVNTHSVAVTVTIEWGEATNPNGRIPGVVPPQSGLYMLVPGNVIQNGLEIRVFASITNVVVIHGFVNRITA